MARRPAIERVGATEQQIDAHIPSASIRQPGRVSVVEYSQRRLGDASNFASRNRDISNGIEIRFRVDHPAIGDNEIKRLRKSGIVRQAYGSESYPPRFGLGRHFAKGPLPDSCTAAKPCSITTCLEPSYDW
jgi:hypothetical protein